MDLSLYWKIFWKDVRSSFNHKMSVCLSIRLALVFQSESTAFVMCVFIAWDAHWCKNSNQIAFIVSVMLIKLHRFFVMKKANQFKIQQITLFSYFTTNHHRCRRHCRHRRRWSFIVYILLLNEQYWCMHAKKPNSIYYLIT